MSPKYGLYASSSIPYYTEICCKVPNSSVIYCLNVNLAGKVVTGGSSMFLNYSRIF